MLEQIMHEYLPIFLILYALSFPFFIILLFVKKNINLFIKKLICLTWFVPLVLAGFLFLHTFEGNFFLSNEIFRCYLYICFYIHSLVEIFILLELIVGQDKHLPNYKSKKQRFLFLQLLVEVHIYWGIGYYFVAHNFINF